VLYTEVPSSRKMDLRLVVESDSSPMSSIGLRALLFQPASPSDRQVHGCGSGKELRVVLLAGVMLICTSRPGCPAMRPRVTPAVGIHTDVSHWTQQPAADYRVSWRDKKKISDIFGGAPEWAFDGQNGLYFVFQRLGKFYAARLFLFVKFAILDKKKTFTPQNAC
jgi:hypothetical protein